MSLPACSTQAELFSTAALSASLFGATDRYRLFAQLVFPALATARGQLEKCYCADNGRVAVEPVLMLGVSLLQYLDGLPDRQAVEMLRYHAGDLAHPTFDDFKQHPSLQVARLALADLAYFNGGLVARLHVDGTTVFAFQLVGFFRSHLQ